MAGLLDAALGPERVRATRVNDPDRTLPGDVGVLAPEGGWAQVFEVRDKAVTEADLHHFLHKARAAGVTRLAMVALAGRQGGLDAQIVRGAAAAQGVQLVVRTGWAELVEDVAFWAATP